jgi:hypothetical protein
MLQISDKRIKENAYSEKNTYFLVRGISVKLLYGFQSAIPTKRHGMLPHITIT